MGQRVRGLEAVPKAGGGQAVGVFGVVGLNVCWDGYHAKGGTKAY